MQRYQERESLEARAVFLRPPNLVAFPSCHDRKQASLWPRQVHVMFRRISSYLWLGRSFLFPYPVVHDDIDVDFEVWSVVFRVPSQRQAPVCSQAPKVHDWFRLAPDRYIGEFVTNFEDFRDRQGWIISLIILETLAHLYWKDWKGMTEASQTPTS